MSTQHKVKDIFVDHAISPEFIGTCIARHSHNTVIGAHDIFLGQIRADTVDGRTVVAIEYTTYKTMALQLMQSIREDIFSTYHLTCLHVYHSLGRVNAGELCLFVFTSSVHRQEATRACEELVGRIKAELPIWGKELFMDETHQWKVNRY